jgi:hypothetical protein
MDKEASPESLYILTASLLGLTLSLMMQNSDNALKYSQANVHQLANSTMVDEPSMYHSFDEEKPERSLLQETAMLKEKIEKIQREKEMLEQKNEELKQEQADVTKELLDLTYLVGVKNEPVSVMESVKQEPLSFVSDTKKSPRTPASFYRKSDVSYAPTRHMTPKKKHDMSHISGRRLKYSPDSRVEESDLYNESTPFFDDSLEKTLTPSSFQKKTFNDLWNQDTIRTNDTMRRKTKSPDITDVLANTVQQLDNKLYISTPRPSGIHRMSPLSNTVQGRIYRRDHQ